jgi:SAM-dependent methyltransferase
MNGIVRAAITATVSHLRQHGCRVLEIGAGTGGTTAAVLPALAGTNTSYTFTDVGPLFLSKARSRFSDCPFVEFAQLDIERDPETQGFKPGSFDVIVAANVLHATRNLHATVERTLRLLAPGGLLVLLETTRHPSWFDVSTGLIHGWQIFDDDLRGDHPLVAEEAWSALLREHGAADVQTYPAAGSPAEILGQHVIVVRAPERTGTAEVPVSGVQHTRAEPATVAAGPSDVRQRLEGATPLEAREVLVDFVLSSVAAVLRLDASALASDQRLMDLGVDSLMAVELRNRLTMGLGLERKLPATLIFDYPTVDAAAGYLAADVLRLQEVSGESAAAATVTDDALEEIAGMDEAAIEAMLNKTLGAL